jgi:hypothetical protein
MASHLILAELQWKKGVEKSLLYSLDTTHNYNPPQAYFFFFSGHS